MRNIQKEEGKEQQNNQRRLTKNPSPHTHNTHTYTYVRTALYPPEKFNARPSLIGWVGGRSCVAMVDAEE